MADRALPILAPRYRSYKDDGTMNAGGSVYFYEAGTTTAKDTYQDAEATAANANPVVLDSRGEAAIYGRGAYKIVEKDSDDNQIGAAMDGVLLPEITDDALALLNDGTVADMRDTLDLGSAATKDAGTDAGNVLLLDESAKLPALDGSNLTNIAAGAAALPKCYIAGLKFTRVNATTFSLTAGVCRDSTNSYNMALTTTWTKTLDAWASGTAHGSLDTGSIAAAAWYHVYLICTSAGVTDVAISRGGVSYGGLVLTTTNLGSYVYYRYIGVSFLTAGSQIVAMVHNTGGDDFVWASPPLDFNSAAVHTTAQLATLSVPPDIQVNATVNARCDTADNAETNFYLSSPDATDEAVPEQTTIAAPLFQLAANNGSHMQAGQIVLRTNTTQQIRVRSSADTTAHYLAIATVGWSYNRFQS